MKSISPELESHFAGELTTLATCWRLIREDGVQLGFTDHDQILLVDDLQYDSIAGFTPSAVESKSDMSVDNLDLDGQLYPSKITQEDLLAGLYDYAEIEIFVVNYEELSQGKMIMKRGRLGEVSLVGSFFHAEVRGLTQHLCQTLGEIYSQNCRAILGDSRCKVDLTEFAVMGSISEIVDNSSFISDELNQADGWFSGGELKWLSGANADSKVEVKEFIAGINGGLVSLVLPMNRAMQVGDEFEIIAGCDKSHLTCQNKFANMINFRGEPYVPGVDAMLTTAGTMNKNNRSG
jgi:uncharacterized phage protein (TIGR02218 family)